MKIRKKIGDLGKDQVRQIVEDFLADLDEGAVALLEYFEESDNPEFETLEVDSEGKILSFTAKDGSHYIYNVKSETIDDLIERVSVLEEQGGLDNFENVEDVEGRTELIKDAEGKLVGYRRKDGVKVENAGIETNKLLLTEEGMNDFQQALKNAGFNPGGGGDFSDAITEKGKKPVCIPMPRCASLNILSDIDLTQLSKKDRGGIQKVNYDVKVQVEFFDGQGVYFKKWALISAQGNSSMNLEKKNISLKLFDTEDVEGTKKKWGKGDTFGTKFGDWVMQKTYHLKAYHTDFIRGSSVVAYQLADEVYKNRGIFEDRPWKKELIDFSTISSSTPDNRSDEGLTDNSLQVNNDARCMPDGFPVIVFQQGTFYGVFSWQLKKDSANFNFDTSNAKHIHIDGDLYASNLWGGSVNWEAFEIRNPEDLITVNGEDYDGDFPKELIGSNSVYQEGFTLNQIPQDFAGGTIVVNIGVSTYNIQVTANMSISDIIDSIVAGNYSSDGYTCLKDGNTAVFKDILDRYTPTDISLEFLGTVPLTFTDNVISVKYNNSDKKHKRSNSVKNYIIALSNVIGQINALAINVTQNSDNVDISIGDYAGLYNSETAYARQAWVKDNNGNYFVSLHGTDNVNKPLSDTLYWFDITTIIGNIRTAFETYFDIDNIVDYQLISMAVGDADGFGKNWQWVTYDGVKWYVNQYDKDCALGNHWSGTFTTKPLTGWINSSITLPCGVAIKYYRDLYKERWNSLVQAGIFTSDNLIAKVKAWVDRIGEDNFRREWERWTEAPCNRDSKIDFDNWFFTGNVNYYGTGILEEDKWNAETNYNAGDKVWFKGVNSTYHYEFEAVQSNINKPCLTDSYSVDPKSMGYHDNVWRYFKYIIETFSNQNTFINSLN